MLTARCIVRHNGQVLQPRLNEENLMKSSYPRIPFTRLLGILLFAALMTTVLVRNSLAEEWADLSGRFVFDGDPPAAAKVNVTKDVECCGKFDLKSEKVVVGSDGGLASVVVWVRTKKVKVHPDYEQSAGDQIDFDNKDCRFAPHVEAIRTGQTLRLKNSDSVAHNSQALTNANPQFNVNLPPGGNHEVVFKKSERLPVPISCAIHPWMKGYLVVKDNPYMAVSGEDGKFKIEKLPAGTELEFQVWQESSGYVDDVKIDGKKQPWKRGRFKQTLSPGENDLGDIFVSSGLFE
jgi:plastocyanin